jgi:hypothetical protein
MGDWSDDDTPAAVSSRIILSVHFSNASLIRRSQQSLSPRKTMMTGEIQTRKAADLDLQVSQSTFDEF